MGDYNHESDDINEALGGIKRADVMTKYQELLIDNKDSLDKLSKRVELVETNMTPKEMAVIISVLTDELDERIEMDNAMPEFLDKAVMGFREDYQSVKNDREDDCNCEACTRRRELMAEHGITNDQIKSEMKKRLESGEGLPPEIEKLKDAITNGLKAAGIEGVMSFAGTEAELKARGGIEGIIKEEEAAESKSKGIIRAGGEGGNA